MKPPLPSARVNLLVLLLALSLLLSVTHPPISQIPLAWASPDQSETPAAQSDRQDFVPGELLVKLRGESPELPLSLIQSLGYPISVLEKMEGLGVLRLSVPAGREMESIQL
ncbi:MAG TPA: hypothetical protein VHS06_01845, partial [Chloroflexota bacterium]|nr:hypothetical protein [Chloroflexota bacterium]